MEFSTRNFPVYIPGLYMLPIGLNLIFVSTNRVLLRSLQQPWEIILVILWAILELWGFYFALKKRTFSFNSEYVSVDNKPLTGVKAITISEKITYIYIELQNGKKRQLQFLKDDRQALERTASEWCENRGCKFTYK